jgi:hypothetical protein
MKKSGILPLQAPAWFKAFMKGSLPKSNVSSDKYHYFWIGIKMAISGPYSPFFAFGNKGKRKVQILLLQIYLNKISKR